MSVFGRAPNIAHLHTSAIHHLSYSLQSDDSCLVLDKGIQERGHC